MAAGCPARLVVALALTLSSPVLTSCTVTPSASATATQSGPPDISGTWGPRFVQSLSENPPLLPEALARFKATRGEDDPINRCEPPGIPRLVNLAFPFEILQTAAVVYFLFEYDQHVRRVFIGGKHPENLDPTWLGHSVGHWEGRTLVVDTIGFHDTMWLDMRGHPHSDALHVIERYTLSADANSLQHEVTIDDPKMYSKPWQTVTKSHARRPDLKIQEFICEP